MSAGGQPNQWLRRELTLRLLPLLVIVAATAALGTYTARRLADQVFDRWLFDAAQSAGALIRFERGSASLDLPPAAERLLLYDELDRTYFIVTQGRRVLTGASDLPLSGHDARRSARGETYETSFAGAPVRVAHIVVVDGHGHQADVRVAETLLKRGVVTRELDLVLLPMALLVFLAAAAIIIAVRRTVRPLESIAAQWREHSHRSLEPVRADGLPRELMPFASALNDLLARIRAMLARERQFAATAAHQLRTPLAGLQLGLARAAASPDIEAARLVVQELNVHTRRAGRLIQQLLALGRLDPEAQSGLQLQTVDLVALAHDVGATHADRALERGIELELVAGTSPVRVQVQPDLVAEALTNLIDNAIRYTPAPGRVLIEVDDGPPRVAVSDSGPGIPDDERDTVFERFTRGKEARGEGSGLGLSIVSDVAALHRAELELRDSAWGGAQITLRFTAPAASGDTGSA